MSNNIPRALTGFGTLSGLMLMMKIGQPPIRGGWGPVVCNRGDCMVN